MLIKGPPPQPITDEADWHACTDLWRLSVTLNARGVLTDRKARLIVIACCRMAWRLMPEAANRAEVAVAERFADGEASDEERGGAARALQAKCGFDGSLLPDIPRAICVADRDTLEPPEYCAPRFSVLLGSVSQATERWAREHGRTEGFVEAARRGVFARQAAVIHDAFGPLPFRRPHLDPEWLAWNDSAALRLARRAYDERAFDMMPILGDALEEVGCGDEALLNHCRAGGEHHRGCWGLDLILGKA